MQRTLRNFAIVCLTLAVGGCVSGAVYKNKPANVALADGRPVLGDGGYRIDAVDYHAPSRDLLLFLTLSGGGKRSSAFSYGVLRGLRDTPITVEGRQARLLDEVAGIASVSGGTFTSAYYGLYGDRIFTDFERDFLSQDLESYIWGIYFLPWNWTWMFDPVFGTSDAMENVYDKLMFHGATFADFRKRGTPIIWIGATDITYGRVFTFNQDTFDYLCSDLDSFPIARAVAASNGFPIVFWPITLKNYADRCHGYRPSWLDRQVEADADTLARRRLLVEAAEDYLNVDRTRYIHLQDGGIADNLAMRGLLNAIMEFTENAEFLQSRRLQFARRVVIISVDGELAQDTSLAQEQKVTGFGTILGAVSGTMIDKYNFETLSLAREQLAHVIARLKKLRCRTAPFIEGHACGDVEGYVLHFSLSGIDDAAVRKRLQSIPTGLTIDQKDVDALVAAGEAQVKASREIVDVVKVIEQKPIVRAAGRR